MKRRHFLSLLGLAGGSGLTACRNTGLSISNYWPDESKFLNPCLDSKLPDELMQHDVVLSAFEGIDTTQVWDGHVHLLGIGDTDSGAWVDPNALNPIHLWRYIQFRFYMNASCPSPQMPIDQGYVARLESLRWGRGSRLLLLAFDYAYDERGERLLRKSAFHIPNDYAARVHRQFPSTFEWIASIHPYRQDCLEALQHAFSQGTRGIKWLPSAMGIDPASPLCDRFYKALAHLDIPLLCHSGSEHAVTGVGLQAYNNPLALRRALDHGVKVILAHCASEGKSRDLDHPSKDAPLVENFALFTRLMEEPRYYGLVFGDISAMSQFKRADPYLETLLTRTEWHSRLLYGSDYPLPGVIPLVSLRFLVKKNYITPEQAQVLTQIRQHNILLFDFILSRHLQTQGHHFSPEVFYTRPLWTGTKILKPS